MGGSVSSLASQCGILVAKTRLGVHGKDGIVHGGLALVGTTPQLKHAGRIETVVVVFPNETKGANPGTFFQTTTTTEFSRGKQLLDPRRFGQCLHDGMGKDGLVARIGLGRHGILDKGW